MCLRTLLCLTLIFTLMSSQVKGEGNEGYTNQATSAVSLSIGGAALLAIKTPNVNLSMSGAMEAGAAFKTAAADSTTRLRISSLVEGAKTRNISANLNAQPEGINLVVTVKAPNSNFYGVAKRGKLLSDVILTTASQHIVTGIGTCWSGTNDDDGYVIKYSCQLVEGAAAIATTTVIVTYTLSEAS
jgi:hypothetical protein